MCKHRKKWILSEDTVIMSQVAVTELEVRQTLDDSTSKKNPGYLAVTRAIKKTDLNWLLTRIYLHIKKFPSIDTYYMNIKWYFKVDFTKAEIRFVNYNL